MYRWTHNPRAWTGADTAIAPTVTTPADAQALFAAKAAADKAAADAMAAKLAASPAWAFYRIASPISAAVSAFHGYRRNQSIGWALAWAVAGGLLPVFVPVIALAQGFGKPKRKG